MAVTPQQVVQGLEQRGIPRTAAIGLAGNFAVESGFEPGINEIAPVVPGSRGGFGLAQWTGPRRRQFEAFAKSQGRALDDLDTQLDFTVWELRNTEKAAADSILSAATPEDAARAVSERYLRPGVPHLDRRIASAQEIAGGAGDDQLAGGAGADAPAAFDLGAAMDELLAAPTDQPDPAAVYAATAGFDLGAAMDELLGAAPVAEERVAQPPSIDVNTAAIPEQTGRFELDIARSTARPMTDVAGAAMRGATGAGPSVVGQMLPEGTPDFVGRAGDVGLAALSGIGAVTTGAAGLAGDVAEAAGMSPGSSRRLARDLAAIPEAFAGSPQGVAGRTQAATRRVDVPAPVAGDAARVEPPLSAAPTARAALTAELSPEQFGQLARQAANGGIGSRAAAQKLAAEARVNPEAAAAAKRLGVDLPADVLTDHTQLRSAVGLTRSQAGSLAEADWRDTVVRAIDQADDAINEIGGSPDLSDISDRVYRSLARRKDNLSQQSEFIFDLVNSKVPRGTAFEPNNVVRTLNEAITDLGGVDGLSAQEQKLFRMVTGGQPVTYERLMREKRQIGRAIGNQSSPYNDADQALLKKLYGALSEDQLSNVQRILGDDYRIDLEVANGLYAKKKALEDTITDAFGNDLQGSVASKLRTAITQGSKGDIAGLNRVLQVVPKELRGEAILSSISALSRQRAGGLGAGEGQPFGFAQYAQLYRGLRQNSEVYKAIAKEIRPEQLRVMNDLFQISNRITDARANVLSTGKANQALVQSMFAEGIVEKVLNSAPGRTTRAAIGGAAGAAGGGNLGAAIGAGLASGNIGKNRMEAASRLFRSQQFQDMMTEAATTGAVSPQAQRRVARSGAFKQFAKRSGITDPQAWIAATVATEQAAQTQESK